MIDPNGLMQSRTFHYSLKVCCDLSIVTHWNSSKIVGPKTVHSFSEVFFFFSFDTFNVSLLFVTKQTQPFTDVLQYYIVAKYKGALVDGFDDSDNAIRYSAAAFAHASKSLRSIAIGGIGGTGKI